MITPALLDTLQSLKNNGFRVSVCAGEGKCFLAFLRLPAPGRQIFVLQASTGLELLSFKKSALGAEKATRKEPEPFPRLLLAIALEG